MMNHPLDVRYRPAVEALSAVPVAMLALLALQAPFYMVPTVAYGTATLLAILAILRSLQAWDIWNQRYHLNHYRPYTMYPDQIPTDSNGGTFLGQGFRFTETHARLYKDLQRAAYQNYIRPFWWQRGSQEEGNYQLHNLERRYRNIFLTARERAIHLLVGGATQNGKSSLIAAFVHQDARRPGCTVVVDPKGGGYLLTHAYHASRHAGKPFVYFSLAHPDVSLPYSILGSYDKQTEPASRLFQRLPNSGDSAAFALFVWRYSYLLVQVLEGLEFTVDAASLEQHLLNPWPMVLQYLERLPELQNWTEALPENKQRALARDGCPLRERAQALQTHCQRLTLADPLAPALLKLLTLDEEYYDKIIQSAYPTLAQLNTDHLRDLLSPLDTEHVLNWSTLLDQDVVVYIGLDSQRDPEVARTVGNFLIADLNAKSGARFHRAELTNEPLQPVSFHWDELESIITPTFLSYINKTAGAGFGNTVYLQTYNDMVYRLGSKDAADAILGNFNTRLLLRVKNQDTARILIDETHQVEMLDHMVVARTTDQVDLERSDDFVGSHDDRISTKDSDLLTPAMVMGLPPGHGFYMSHGFQLTKVRIPLMTLPEDALDSAAIHCVLAEAETPGWIP